MATREFVPINQALEPRGLRMCTKCREVLPLANYGKCAANKNGLASWCKACAKAINYGYYHRNADKCRDGARKWRERNPGRMSEYQAEYRATNQKRLRAMDHDRRKKRRATVMGALHERIATQMRRVLRGEKKGRPVESLLDFTWDELRAHLERQFLKGMGWHNMREWHIDHIVPLSSFRSMSPGDSEFRRAWALTNLRPLWAKDNVKKGRTKVTLI